MDGSGTDLGDYADAALHLGKRTFDQQHRPDRCRIGKQPPSLARVEEAREKRAVENRSCHVSAAPFA